LLAEIQLDVLYVQHKEIDFVFQVNFKNTKEIWGIWMEVSFVLNFSII
jgi:hypothetical protein